MYYKVDLSDNYNHTIYKDINYNKEISKLPISTHGIKNIHIIEKIKYNLQFFNIEFEWQPNKNLFDNISCDGNFIPIINNSYESISFIGFSEMGTICDDVIISTFERDIQIPLIMKTFHTNNFKGIDDFGPNNDCKKVVSLLGDDNQKHHLYFWKVIFDKYEKITAITLPVNRAIHIMCITLA